MKMEPVSSSTVESVGYDAENFTLRVRFIGGRTYDYSGVSQVQFDALRNAESVGKYLNMVIKSQFPYVEV